jgi:3-keto-5-aminohexanoate cleavage enzyme
VFARTLDLIRKESDIVIQASTGGTPKGGIGNLSLEERAGALNDRRVEVGSLNMGSVNFGDDPFINSGADIRAWAALMKAKGIFPELEIFELGMLETVKRIAEESLLAPPYLCALCPGYSLPATTDVLFFLKSMLPPNSLWGVNHQKMPDFSLSITAIGMGAAYVRVGFEDGLCYAPGRVARKNAELVERIGEVIKGMGLEIASPADVRSLFNLSARML